MSEKPSQLDYGAVKTELGVLLEAWRDEWSEIGHVGVKMGPRWIYEREKRMMSEERVRAWEPERQAMREVIEYVSTILALAYQDGDQDRMLDEIESFFGSFDHYAKQFYQEFLQKAIFKRTLALVRESEHSEGASRADLVDTQRTRISSVVTFGITP